MKSQRFVSLRPNRDLPELLASLKEANQEPEDGRARSWYSIRNVSRTEAEVFIYDFIGEWGVSASDFVRELSDLTAKKITLRINSPGGDVFDGLAIYNAIRRHSAEIDAFIDGLAASAASFIAMAADSVTMMPHAQMMIHEAAGFAIGNAADMRKLADILDQSSDNIAAIYAEKAGGTLTEWRDAMKAETWYTDQGAVDAGLADGIDGQEDAAGMPKKMPKKMPMEPMHDVATPPASETEPEQPQEPPAPVDWGAVFKELVDEDLLSAIA